MPSLLAAPMPPTRSSPPVLLLAEHEARELRHAAVDAEHLLVAAITECARSRRLRMVLDRYLVSLVAVRAAAPNGSHRSTFAALDDDTVTCTPAAMRVLARAMQHASCNRVGRVLPQDVLLAVLDSLDDPALGGGALLLESLGVDVRRFRRAFRRAVRRD